MGWLYSLVAAGGRSWVDRKWQKSSCRKINFAKQQKKRQQQQRQIVVGLVDLWPTYPETFDSGVCAPSPHGHESERYYVLRTLYAMATTVSPNMVKCYFPKWNVRKSFVFVHGCEITENHSISLEVSLLFHFPLFFCFLFFSYLFGFSLFCVGQQNRVNFLI